MAGKKISAKKPAENLELLEAEHFVEEMRGATSELRIFRQSFLNSSDAILITDENGVIVDVNPAFETIYGFSRQEAIGHTPRLLRHDTSDPEIFSRMWDDILDSEKGFWKGEILNRRKDGTMLPTLLSITPIHDNDGRTTHYMALAIDISQKRELEAKVQQLRREYGAFLRHEMRNHLAAVSGYLELAMHHSEPAPERLGRYLKCTQDALLSTIRIIDALRELEHYELGLIELQLQSVCLSEIIEQARADLKPLAESYGVAVEIRHDQDSGQVEVDSPKMMSVFFNLMKNAIEHVGGTTEAIIRVRIYKERNRPAIAINNRGPMLPPDRLATFFERFNTTKKNKGGTGLGTTYAALITKAHGGDIRVASNAKDGTTVTVLLRAQ